MDENFSLNISIKSGEVRNKCLNTKNNGFCCHYGFFCEIPTLLVASEIVSGYVLYFVKIFLRPYDITITSNLLFVQSFMQFQLNNVRDVIFLFLLVKVVVHSRD